MNQPGLEQKWIARRLERMRASWTEEGLAAEIAVKRGYIRGCVGSAPVLSEEILQLVGDAWTTWGPHVPVPPARYAALIVPVLQLAKRIHPSLAEWVLAEVGNHVRTHGWHSQNRHLFQLAGQLKSGLFRAYCEWMMSRIDRLCGEVARPLEHRNREEVSLQVLRSLFSGVGLAGLNRRILAWSNNHPGDRKYCPHLVMAVRDVDVAASIPEVILESISPAGVELKHLWNKNLLATEGAEMQHCAGTMGSAIRAAAYLFLSMTEIATGFRATMVLALERENRWFVEDFRGFRNEDLSGSSLEKHGNAVLIRLNCLLEDIPILEWYRAQNKFFRSEISCSICEHDSISELRNWLPGIGMKEPKAAFTSAWKECSGERIR